MKDYEVEFGEEAFQIVVESGICECEVLPNQPIDLCCSVAEVTAFLYDGSACTGQPSCTIPYDKGDTNFDPCAVLEGFGDPWWFCTNVEEIYSYNAFATQAFESFNTVDDALFPSGACIDPVSGAATCYLAA